MRVSEREKERVRESAVDSPVRLSSLVSFKPCAWQGAFSHDGRMSLWHGVLATTLPMRARVQSHACTGLGRDVAARARDGGQGTFDAAQTILQERISERI